VAHRLKFAALDAGFGTFLHAAKTLFSIKMSYARQNINHINTQKHQIY
jgi:hypothetical protein